MNNEIKKNSWTVTKKVLKILKNISICIIAITLSITIMGLIYEKMGFYSDKKEYAVPGKVVEVNGHDMHVFAEGSGNSTVVFISGFGTPSSYVDFYPLYSEISKHTRIAVCERPGYGFSKVANTSRDIDTMTTEMHEALEKSGEKPPYIFVAHSMGSLEAIRFAQLYENEVKGIITIDGGNPNYYAREQIAENQIAPMKLQSILKEFGIMRLLFNYSESFVNVAYSPRNHLEFIPPELKVLDKAMYLKTLTNKNKKDEMINLQSNAQIIVDSGNLGEVPLIILTAGNEISDNKWKNSQEDFSSWSTDSEQKVINDSPHYIHQYLPDKVNSEILKIFNTSN